MPAGLYIHVPFCKSRCIYCDFFSETNSNSKAYLNSLLKESVYYSHEWKDKSFNTLYFGGGTPSLLTSEEINRIINNVKSSFCFDENAEITLECNPDDITEMYAHNIVATGVNRISIGIQSFDDDILKFLSRRHNAEQAIKAVEMFDRSGIKNISIDLIFGIPGLSSDDWIKQLTIAASLPVKHISAYMLTTHENTVLSRLQGENKITLPDDDECFEQFKMTGEVLSGYGFKQYEISNFSVPGYESKHNIKYWSGDPYLGLGPSAHSYMPYKRFSNQNNVDLYINRIDEFINKRNYDISDENQQYNEYVMNSLRTFKGLDIEALKDRFPLLFLHFCKEVDNMNREWYFYEGSFVKLTIDGMFVSDYIIEKLFV
jgi:oxygen-independent coproporphyrinogen III oxidase